MQIVLMILKPTLSNVLARLDTQTPAPIQMLLAQVCSSKQYKNENSHRIRKQFLFYADY